MNGLNQLLNLIESGEKVNRREKTPFRFGNSSMPIVIYAYTLKEAQEILVERTKGLD